MSDKKKAPSDGGPVMTDCVPTPFQGTTSAPKRQTLWTAHELLTTEFPPIRWIVPGLLTSGLYVLAGAPKLGKSWLSLGIATACSVGGAVLGKLRVDEIQTLYLALEDNPRRLQSRLEKIGARPSRESIIATEWPQGAAGVAKLREFLETYKQLKLIVIDTWIRFAGPHDGNDYGETSSAAAQLKALADEYDVCITVVHHTRKNTGGEDYLDSILGSTGLSAVADGSLVLRRARGNRDATLSVTGRDIEEAEFALRFDAEIGSWVLLGTTAEVQETDARQEIYDLLAAAEGPMGPKAVAEALGKNRNTIKQLLWKMASDGVLESLSGQYRITVNPVNRKPEGEPGEGEAVYGFTQFTVTQGSGEDHETTESDTDYETTETTGLQAPQDEEPARRESIAERLRRQGKAVSAKERANGRT